MLDRVISQIELETLGSYGVSKKESVAARGVENCCRPALGLLTRERKNIS